VLVGVGARVRFHFISPFEEKAESSGLSNSSKRELLLLLPLPFLTVILWGWAGLGEEREREGEASSGWAGQGLPRLSILSKIEEFNHRRHHHRASSMGMYVKALASFLGVARLRSACSRAAGSAFLLWRTLSLLCRLDSVSLWENRSSFSFPLFVPL